MPTRSRKRGPPATRRRALELLASFGAEGCSGAIILAHGFTAAQIVELVRAGLATATTEHGIKDRRSIKIARVWITEVGRKALAEAKA